jgi:CRISPR-associated protein Csm4
MKTYRIRINTQSLTLTPFQADTIFGHLCWAKTHKEGDKALQEFLQSFKKEPPFVISDGFPGDLLPKPLTAEFIFESDDKKEIKKIEFVSVEEFNTLRKGEKCEIKKVDLIKHRTTPHAKISRITGTTPKEGGLYSLEEYFIPYVSIYLKTVTDEWKDKVMDLFNELSKSGYGSKKSIGKGQFTVESIEEFKFAEIDNANGFVTLSNFCPMEKDPTEGFYKTFVKYGKLGEEFTFCGNPFKRPLVMIKTGSVFKTNNKIRDFYGRMVEEIAPQKPEVVQYAYAFALPIIVPIKKQKL